jgi:signal transduction histidine kinase
LQCILEVDPIGDRVLPAPLLCCPAAQLSMEGELVLQVCDTGIGMREEDLHRVLEPFVQVENELTRRYEGTGLGLSLSKQLTELHDGRIGIVSRPNIGTTVTVYLPASRLRRG